LTPRLKLLSEEVVRWALEVKLRRGSTWKIAFTNPTAGPWKRVMAENSAGKLGEIHRFEIDEKRPDLIIYSDVHRTVVIVEAKTDISGLQNSEQVLKTSALYTSLSEMLRQKGSNEYWGGRAAYSYQLGLLWSKKREKSRDVAELANKYLMQINDGISDILCFQGSLADETLEHQVFWAKRNMSINLDNYDR
jgi:hypothetical protein